MDVIQKRFPTLAVNILNNLDDKSLVKYKKSNKENCEFLVQERFYWIRILKKYNVLYFETSKETWKKAISKTPCGIVKKLATAVITFIKRDSDYFWTPHFSMKKEQLTPLLIVVYDGDLTFFQKINEKTSEPNQAKSGISPIHFAAYRGNLTLCKLLLNEPENKNSYGRNGATALHYAAMGGNLEVYQLLYDAAVVKNPKLRYCGTTPIDLAVIQRYSNLSLITKMIKIQHNLILRHFSM